MTAPSSDSREGQMMLYQITVSDLTYFKSQQWSLTNHAFLLIAAVVGARQLLEKPAKWELAALAGFVVLIVVAGLVLLSKLQDSIVVRQARLDAAREMLGLEFHKIWTARAKKTEYVHAISILRGALVLGGTVAGWLLLRSSPV